MPACARIASVFFLRMFPGRRKSLRELMEVESRLEQMRESARAIQWRADPATFEFTQVSREARNILGYSIERWLTESNFLEKSHARRGLETG